MSPEERQYRIDGATQDLLNGVVVNISMVSHAVHIKHGVRPKCITIYLFDDGAMGNVSYYEQGEQPPSTSEFIAPDDPNTPDPRLN